MKWSAADYSFMTRALELARKGLYSAHPNPRVGCVLVKQDRVIAAGWHEYTGGAHAEINALNNAIDETKGASCYVTLEPCSHTGRTPPCTDALITAGIERLVAAMPDPNPAIAGSGFAAMETAGVEVATGLLGPQAERLNPGFIMRMTHRRPYVRCKLAMSLDGRTALEDGASKWITAEAARMDVQRLRAQSSAIMTGIGTVLADDPGLNVREIDTNGRQPLRVVIDPDLNFPATAKMLKPDGRTLIFTCSEDQAAHGPITDAGAEIIVIARNGREFLESTLLHLAVTEEINEILLESGARLAGSMLSNGFIDELILYQAPVLLGDSAKGLFHLPGINTMTAKIELELMDTRHIGTDLRHTLKVKSRLHGRGTTNTFSK